MSMEISSTASGFVATVEEDDGGEEEIWIARYPMTLLLPEILAQSQLDDRELKGSNGRSTYTYDLAEVKALPLEGRKVLAIEQTA